MAAEEAASGKPGELSPAPTAETSPALYPTGCCSCCACPIRYRRRPRVMTGEDCYGTNWGVSGASGGKRLGGRMVTCAWV